MLKKKSGITLIALIITIIVLLILAGISISAITGENGTLKRASNASEKTKDGKEDEQVKLAVEDALGNGVGTLTTENVRGALVNEFGADKVTDDTFKGEGPWTFKGERKKYTIEGNGNITESTIFEISDYVKVGDYVNYNPTNEDKDGTRKVADEKLTYTSPVGSDEEHGNGEKVQNFEANENVKWRVININNDGTLDLIPAAESLEEVGKITFESSTGYYYAEQELNNVCAIYGYGYGAVENLDWEYEIGGQPCESIKMKLNGTGARCFSGRELEELTGVSVSELLNLENGTKYSYDSELWIHKFGGGSMYFNEIQNTYTTRRYDQYIDSNWGNLFNDYPICWLGSTYVQKYNESMASLGIRWISINALSLGGDSVCQPYATGCSGGAKSRNVLPVVRIYGDVIDIKGSSGAWNLK